MVIRSCRAPNTQLRVKPFNGRSQKADKRRDHDSQGTCMVSPRVPEPEAGAGYALVADKHRCFPAVLTDLRRWRTRHLRVNPNATYPAPEKTAISVSGLCILFWPLLLLTCFTSTCSTTDCANDLGYNV